MIGGAIWKLTKMGDEEIVYAIDFNHKKERHLNGCTFDGELLCFSGNGEKNFSADPKT